MVSAGNALLILRVRKKRLYNKNRKEVSRKMKKKISRFIIIIILLSMLPVQNALARSRSPKSTFQYRTPQDFVQWINGRAPDRFEKLFEKYVDVYCKKRDSIVAPEMENIPLNCVCWGTENTAINYRFYQGDFFCIIYMYPVVACQKEQYYAEDIGTLVKERDMIEYNQLESSSFIDEETGEEYTETVYYEKKKLRLKDGTVNCVQRTRRRQSKTTDQTAIDFHFFHSGMYVYVENMFYQNEGEKKQLQAMKTCSFQKLYTQPKLQLNKKKQKVTKKNAILHATMYNPTKKRAKYVSLYFYDNRTKKYKLYYQKRVAGKNQRKNEFAIKLNVNSCLKQGKKQLKRRKAFLLERKKKYKYMIRVQTNMLVGRYQVNSKKRNYDVVGSFRLK